MAERIVSPGVFTRENDLSFLAQGIGEIGAAFIGPFKQGPAFVPTIVRTQSEFEEIFGTPDGTYFTEHAVQNYLREAGTATIVRVAGIGGYTQNQPIGILASGSNGQKIVGVLYSTNFGDEGVGFLPAETSITSSLTSGSFVISGKVSSGSAAVSVSSSISSLATNDLADVFGESPFGAKAAYTYLFFESASLAYGSNATDGGLEGVKIYEVNLPNQDYSGTSDIPAYKAAETPMVKSQLISGERYDLFKFVTLGHGTLYNTKFKVGISNVKAAGEDGSTDYSTFTVTIRSFGDTDKRKSVIETFNNVNLDPASPNYIAKRIGDRYNEIEPSGKITENGDYTNRSKFVRVQMAENSVGNPISAAPFGHGAYTNPIATAAGDATKVPAVIYQTNSINNTSSSPINFSGFDFESNAIANDNKQYLKPIPEGAQTGSNVPFAFDTNGGLSLGALSGSNSADMVKRQFVLAFQEGFDGLNPTISSNISTPITAANTQGFDCGTAVATGTQAYTKAINAISNADEYDINLVVTPGIIRSLHPTVTNRTIDMVEDRQDCFYIADFVNVNAEITDVTEKANEVDSNYVATYYPWIKTVDANTNRLISVPPSVLMPAVFAANDRLAAEWFAPAGLNRGGIIGAVSVLNRLTHSERDTLYENKVNPIAAFPGQGIVAFGQKTLQDRASALDRINVRRLLITVKKFIASTSRFLVFEQNTATTRARFLNTVNPYLEAIQQRQGLYAFRVVMDESNNTPDVIDRNIMAGQIFLQPAKTAEFIVVDFNILPTGASFNA